MASRHRHLAFVLCSFTAVSLVGAQRLSGSDHFKLLSCVIQENLTPNITAWEVSTYPVSPCNEYFVLSPPANNDGVVFYLNGTYYDNLYSRSSVLTDDDDETPPVTSGMVVDQVSDPVLWPLRQECGTSTIGMGIVPKYGIPTLYGGPGEPVACNVNLSSGPAVQLFMWHNSNPLPTGCVRIKLLAQCVNDGPTRENPNPVTCFVDVAGDGCPIY